MILNIPIYEAIISDERCGIDKISLVQSPAVESNFVAFSENKTPVMLSLNDEQQMILGVVARCDYPIYRNDEQLGEYYVNFNRETIKFMAQKLLRDNHQNDVNIEHLFNSDVDGVEMVELFIKDTVKGINPTGFEDISDGSLFATFKVNNQEIWQRIKSGEFKGYSLEGLFDFSIETNKTIDDDVELNEILSLLDEIKKHTRK